MDITTTAESKTLVEPSRGPTIIDYVARGLASPQLGALVALAAALTLGVGLILWASKPDFIPVFEQMNGQDAAAITEALRTENIPYRIQPRTGLVLVPADQADQIRIKLAASGLSQSTSMGLELLQQEQALGTSQFIETARYQHALETELGRTISNMRNVESARVHLALPKQSVFIRDRAKASASIMVKLSAGRVLEKGQVAAIVSMVASSIPYLEASQVTIVDQWGRLLSTGDESATTAETRKQYEYARKLEALYSKRIEELLTPLVGIGRVRATVTTEVDFSTNEQTQEKFEADPAKVRSEQNQEQESQGPIGAAGIPGALTNQPPGAGTTDPNAANGQANSKPSNSSRQSTRNYELDKTITHMRQAPGSIKRVSAAVIVDDRITVNDKGETTRTPLEPEEIEQFTAMAREAIGFDEQRGDSVVVFNRSFQPVEEIMPIEPAPLWEQPWVWNLSKQVLAGLSVLLLILMVVRPAMRNLKPSKQTTAGAAALPDGNLPEDQLSLSHGGGAATQLPPPPQVYGDILHMARAMAADDPKRVAKVVKDWVGKDE
ncbi:MAG TPA: flagellar basal body M-ring protein FliF [Chromatiales bacterium]|nr:flagellar basal body M-ring protein FliF [Thiotrichales bacterium]HIP68535.1 flagellar basal body M-ring protein FliF [Chromatiales bacterium]